jgi:hypothetical protein
MALHSCHTKLTQQLTSHKAPVTRLWVDENMDSFYLHQRWAIVNIDYQLKHTESNFVRYPYEPWESEVETCCTGSSLGRR